MENDFFSWTVSSPQKGMRLLAFLLEQLQEEEFSNKQLKRAIDRGVVRVNGAVECFSSASVHVNDKIQLWKEWKSLEEESSLTLPVLFQDPFLWIFDKPSGLEVSQEAFAPFFSEPFYLVHRLDKGTSGVILVAKTQKMQSLLEELFAKREVKKKYYAIVEGKVDKPQGFIQNKLTKKRAFQGQTLWGVSNDGQGLLASTHWSLLKSNNRLSLLLCQPLTGRTHQLRVHFSSIGHPILGDYLYCKRFSYHHFVPRLLLHSFSIAFKHPLLHTMVTVQSPVPPIFEQFIGPLPNEKNS